MTTAITKRFAKTVFVNNHYLLAVILFGAFVRASGSGAGCGAHWPLCNGEVLPREPQLQTIIEFTHRITSGLSLPMAVIIAVWAWRLFAKKHPVRLFSTLTVLFLVFEGAIGAGLVLLEHVAENASSARALSMGLHLINTFALTAVATLTWFHAKNPEHTNWQLPNFRMSLGMVLLVITSILGAVTALGDTVFPVGSAGEAWQQGMDAGSHLFVKLRVYHPLVAIATAMYLLLAVRHPMISAFVLLQVGLGFLNVHLLAPIWLQLVHLAIAQMIWMVCVRVGAKQ